MTQGAVAPRPVAIGVAAPLAPWGSPPTPLLPRWYREVLPSIRIPEALRDSAKSINTVGDVGRFWESRSAPLDKVAMRALVHCVHTRRPPQDHVVVPPSVNRSVLERYPLRRRTRNCLRQRELLTGQGAVTVGELLSITNFGLVSLLDLMCVMEASLEQVSQAGGESGTHDHIALELSQGDTEKWADAIEAIKPLLAAASEFWGTETLGDSLCHDLADLASTMGLRRTVDAISIRELTGGHRIADDVLSRLAEIQTRMTPADTLIINRRLLSPRPQTFQELGDQLGITRERVRQVQQRLVHTLSIDVGPQLRVIAAVVRKQLGPVVASSALHSRVAEIFSHYEDRKVSEMAEHLLKEHLGYSCDKQICLDGEAMSVVEALQQVATTVADDVGLVDEASLQARIAGDEWNRHWPSLLARCSFRQLSGRPALRDTAKARVKAALLNIGRPCTRKELAKLSGIAENRVGSLLSVIPGVARADKNRWGLSEWIDDEYEGIPAEIIQRIEEDGGAARVDRILDELPRLFGVSEISVRAYLSTPQFSVGNGYVSVADEASIALRSLDDVIDGRDAAGVPYWTFVVDERYFQGYSLLNFPPELADALGCRPNGRTRVVVAEPAGCDELSVSWRLSSTTGACLGYLSEPLRRLAVTRGDRVRMVIRSSGVVELHRHAAEKASGDTGASAAHLHLKRIKDRRRVI